jgi:hypothetical protein
MLRTAGPVVGVPVTSLYLFFNFDLVQSCRKITGADLFKQQGAVMNGIQRTPIDATSERRFRLQGVVQSLPLTDAHQETRTRHVSTSNHSIHSQS